jgi:hypothetical protein
MAVYALSFKPVFIELLPKLAVIVTAWAVEMADTFAVKSALVEFAGIVTVVGTVTAALLLDNITV